MKTLLIITMSFIFSMSFGQKKSTLMYYDSTHNLMYIKKMSTDTAVIYSVCKERGHFLSGYGSSTLMNCPDYIIDYPDSTVLVHPSCNVTTYICQRCGKEVKKGGKETRTVIWRRYSGRERITNELHERFQIK